MDTLNDYPLGNHLQVSYEVSEMTELIGVGEAAKRLGVHRQRVYELIEAGRIATVKIAGRILIDAAELEKPDIKDRKPGRPRRIDNENP